MNKAEYFRDRRSQSLKSEFCEGGRTYQVVQLLNIFQLANHRDSSRREATRLPEQSLIGQSQREIFLEERLLGLIFPDDQLCCTQASQGECVAGEGYHPAVEFNLFFHRLEGN